MVGVVPVHPVTEPLGLLGDDVGEPVDAGLAHLDELPDAETLDVALGGEAKLLLDLDLDPQSLAVEAVLEPLPVPLHVAEAEEEVLVAAAPCVVHAHRVVCGYGAVDERVGVLRLAIAESVLERDRVVVPPVERLPFHRGKVDPGVDWFKHPVHSCLRLFLTLTPGSSPGQSPTLSHQKIENW